MTEPELRDKEHLILQQVDSGNDDVQKITSTTTLENHHVTYAFQKLEELDLLTVSKPDGTVERIIDGQKRVFQHPKQAELTDKGEQCLQQAETKELQEYENLTHSELVEKVHRLETEISEVNKQFSTFREQVQRRFFE
jgi:predicted transcriptional regulator